MSVARGYHHIAMAVKDFDASVAFYTKTLGFTVSRSWGEENERAMMLDTGDGSYLEVFERPNVTLPSDGGPILHFAIRVADCDALLETVRASGAEITNEAKNVDIPSDPAYPVRIAFFKGPDGEIVELFQER